MDTGPKHRLHLVLVGNGTEMVHRTGFMLKRIFRHERCQEHFSNRIVALSKRDERNRRSGASRTHKWAASGFQDNGRRGRGAGGRRWEAGGER